MRKYKKHREFTGLQKHVWEYLNQPGHTIPNILDNEKHHSKADDQPVWHMKPELDKFVTSQLGLRYEDYDTKNGNLLYKEIALEISKLRKKKIIIDWKKLKTSRDGGVWRLADSTNEEPSLLERHIIRDIKREIRRGDFHSDGSLRTIYARAKQSEFKSILKKQYRKCVLCRFEIPEYMIGAHIVPYHIMRKSDPSNSMNPENGLLLCRFCDVAFEKGSIRIKPDYGIVISRYLKKQDSDIVQSWLEPIPEELVIKSSTRYKPDPDYLRRKLELV